MASNQMPAYRAFRPRRVKVISLPIMLEHTDFAAVSGTKTRPASSIDSKQRALTVLTVLHLSVRGPSNRYLASA